MLPYNCKKQLLFLFNFCHYVSQAFKDNKRVPKHMFTIVDKKK